SPFANISSVPNADFRNGNFAASSTPILEPGTKTPFPGNTIFPDMIDPAARKIMSVLPAANSPGTADPTNSRSESNLAEVGSSHPSSFNFTTRIDENISDNDRMFGTLTHYNAKSPLQPTIPGPLESSVGPGVTTGYQATLGYTHTFSPTLFIAARMGFWRNN